MSTTKPFTIPKQLVMQAYQIVKGNAGAAGIDKQSIEKFDKNFKDNLYKLWNRMSSGSYFPLPVKAVPIPKKSGGQRILGVPAIGDRIAQTVAKLVLEPVLEKHFLPDSYGYRPNKSALDAVDITRKRCWEYDWILEFDIKGLFDNIEHDLLMKAVRWHTDNKWVILYIERWLKAPMQMHDGSITERTYGTPQGGCISPILANLFLHYVFDVWMTKHYPRTPWCRYADDGLIHCQSKQQALALKEALAARFQKCGLELHPSKTKIVCCRRNRRKGDYENRAFDFLGYSFRTRTARNQRTKKLFVTFTPAVSKSALRSIRQTIRQWNIRNRSGMSLQEITRIANPALQGWINYYGRFNPSALYPIWRYFNMTLIAWARRKYKKLARNKTKAGEWIRKISAENPTLFVHWRQGTVGAFV